MQGLLSLRHNIGFRLFFVCGVVLLFAGFALAQTVDDVHVESRQKPNSEPLAKPLKVDVDLVLVPVTVTDAMNRPVTSLGKQDFELYEGEKPQEIRYFFEDEEPLSIAMLLDVSKSMSDKIDIEREALEHFF